MRLNRGKLVDSGLLKSYSSLMMTSTISDFKAHFSEKLRKVRAGAHIIILDREHPIAEVRPIADLPSKSDIRKAIRPFEIPPAPSWRMKADVMSMLVEERGDS
jgi:antitoxin (DNA-binding transcriptional repressor) of toxin-antitoxin stability system